MKLIASALLLSASLIGASAFAGDLDYPPVASASTTSSVSRAQVQADLHQAQANGEIAFGDLQEPTQVAASHLTRAQVQADLQQAKAHGDIAFGESDYQANNG
jgi:ribosome-binding factor A